MKLKEISWHKLIYDVGAYLSGLLAVATAIALAFFLVVGSFSALFVGWAWLLGVTDPWDLLFYAQFGGLIGIFVVIYILRKVMG